MAVRGWGGSIATAIGVAAGAGAAQLGLGYGLGIIAWVPAAQGSSEAAWVASLAWATWIAATSTVAGAVTADRLGTASGGAGAGPADRGTLVDRSAGPLGDGVEHTGILWRLSLAVAAAVGALVTVALIAVPARAAVRADTFSPQTIAAGYAVIGVIVGLIVAIAALGSRAIATNVIATVGWLWLLAIVAVIDGVAGGRGLATAQLGVWHFTSENDALWFRNFYLPGAAMTLGAALLIGAFAALPATRRGDGRVGVAISGAFGPLLVASAYFLAAPRLVGVRAEQLSAYLVAPYAVMAGLAGSVLISALGLRAEEAARARVTGGSTAPGPVGSDPFRANEPATAGLYASAGSGARSGSGSPPPPRAGGREGATDTLDGGAPSARGTANVTDSARSTSTDGTTDNATGGDARKGRDKI